MDQGRVVAVFFALGGIAMGDLGWARRRPLELRARARGERSIGRALALGPEPLAIAPALISALKVSETSVRRWASKPRRFATMR